MAKCQERTAAVWTCRGCCCGTRTCSFTALGCAGPGRGIGLPANIPEGGHEAGRHHLARAYSALAHHIRECQADGCTTRPASSSTNRSSRPSASPGTRRPWGRATRHAIQQGRETGRAGRTPAASPRLPNVAGLHSRPLLYSCRLTKAARLRAAADPSPLTAGRHTEQQAQSQLQVS